MTQDHCRVMVRYNRWMDEKLYAVAAELTDDGRKQDRGAFFKSLHRTLNHLLVADRAWMGRFTGAALQDDWLGPGAIRSLDQELHGNLEELRDARQKMDADIEQWVAALDADKLAAPLPYVRKGVAWDFPLSWSQVCRLLGGSRARFARESCRQYGKKV